MIDPLDTDEIAVNSCKKGEWYGEFYCSFGAGEGSRNWQDAIEHGFISAGGARWYGKTLFMLNPSDRVWVNIAGGGYVGVAEVQHHAMQADEYLTSDKTLAGQYKSGTEFGEDDADYFVAVKWLHKVQEHNAISEVGLFGNQNTIARPRASKWQHTVNRLKEI